MARALEQFEARSAKVLVILSIALLLSCHPALGSDAAQNSSTYQSNLILNVYINDAGKALVTGYADSINGLSFLEASQYRYDNDSKQLYALTDSLTFKTGNDWEAKLFSQGNYSEYHSTFYLPTTVVLSLINSSRGLEYQVSASNESFMVDIHGYDVKDPDVSIKYQLPLINAAVQNDSGATNVQTLALVLLILILASAVAIIWLKRGRTPSLNVDLKGASSPSSELQEAAKLNECATDTPAAYDAENISVNEGILPEPDEQEPEQVSTRSSIVDQPDQKPLEAGYQAYEALGASEDISPELEEDAAETDEVPLRVIEETPISVNGGTGIEITSEMAAVMETLTSRERTVLTALISRKGRMTQADIRYETRIPKSSLTGILLSLERRKLIIKKEWGRTNIIELSEWFLSKKERL